MGCRHWPKAQQWRKAGLPLPGITNVRPALVKYALIMETSRGSENFPTEPAASPAWTDAEGPWWFPSWWEIARLLRWRWLLALPLVALLALLLAGMLLDLRYLGFLWVFGFKVVIFIIAIPVAVLASMMRSAVQMRKDPFCIHCGYGLTGLRDQYQCPECGRAYSFGLIDEYRRNPHWFIERAKSARLHPRARIRRLRRGRFRRRGRMMGHNHKTIVRDTISKRRCWKCYAERASGVCQGAIRGTELLCRNDSLLYICRSRCGRRFETTLPVWTTKHWRSTLPREPAATSLMPSSSQEPRFRSEGCRPID